MKAWFWTLLVFVAAVALALILRDHSGNILIMVQPWRIELSLTFAVLLLLAAFIVLHSALRMITWISGGPGRFRSWKGQRAQRRDYNLLENGWVNILEGRYEQADKDLARLLGKSRSATSKVVAALASARAAHQLGDHARRDDVLAKARIAARDDARLKEAIAVVAAEFYLDDERPEEALVLLQPLQDASSRYFHATRLLLRAHRQLGNDDRVYELTRLMLRRGAIEQSHAMELIEASGAARLRAAGIEGFKPLWNDLKSDEKTLPGIALAAAAIQSDADHHDEAARILEAAIDRNMDAALLSAYAQCPPDQVRRRLNKAEAWLKTHSENAALLAALGRLCLLGNLWGQAERHLLHSMRLRSDMRIHALLGNLYDNLGRPEEAARHWRLACDVAGKLPVATVERLLPPADTRYDPTLVDFRTAPAHGAGPDFEAAVEQHAVVAAGAGKGDAAYAPPASQESAAAATRVAASGPEGLDEYFDTAPIPGVDMSQTSDRPRGTGNPS